MHDRPIFLSKASLKNGLFSILIGIVICSQAREVQSHGLLFEKWLRHTFFNDYQPKGYTQKWDIPASANSNHGSIPVNPKATKYGSSIGLGDALRQYQIDEPFLLIVGFWEQKNPEQKRWVNVQAVRIEPSTWRQLWGKISLADLARLDAIIKDSSLNLEQAREQAKHLKAQEPYASALITLHPKIDRSQRRLQCSLSFDRFFDHLATQADRSIQSQPALFSIPIPTEFSSTPRALKPETK
jgi:hypothetical protein